MSRPALLKKTFTDPRYFLALGFGSGLARYAPGTFGTLAAIPCYYLLVMLPWWGYVLAVLFALGAGIWLCDQVAGDENIKDPGFIVWDEFVGLWVTLFLVPEGWYWVVAGFFVFRFFDVLKPWPVSWLDRELTGGMGIMLDDVAAGIYSLFVLQLANLVINSHLIN